ncbi:hypothetical protein BBJ28_00022180 [Nothophytophthora sp. Chile5]|nr:hypothetical protein BBJ28_00022180 [Nothophytophthora sp. Chile5]
MALNEQTDTMRVILGFFKQHNPGWTEIVSFIIDKDFVEWRVLEEMFLNAKVLLCQFHAISYWKRLTQRRFSLKLTERDEVQASFASMLYSSTQASYDRAYKDFEKDCDDREEVLAYFNKNWHSCRDMWSNHLRGKYFTAGNTTTNRIESNWNQLKLLLGRKTGIDRTVAGLLDHQATIVRKVLSVLQNHQTKSRNPRHVPDFLRLCSAVVSDYVLDKLRSEWTQFRVNMAEATCVRRDDTTEEGTVDDSDVEWSLPSKQNKRSVDYVRLRRNERGNNVVLSSAEKFCYAKAMFDPVITHLKHLPSHKFYAALDVWRKVVGEVMEGEEGQSDATSIADETDSGDSDALTVMDPSEIIDALDVMTAMGNDESATQPATQSSTQPPTQPATQPATQAFTQPPTQPAMILEETLEDRPIDAADLAVSTLSQISLDAIDLSEGSQAILDGTEPSYTGAMSPGLGDQDPPASETTQEPEPEAVVVTASAPVADSPGCGGVESLNLPPPVVMGNPRQERVQGWAAKASMQRYVTVAYPRDLSCTVIDVAQWAFYTQNLGDVLSVLQKFPVIMDEKALRRWDPETKQVSREEARRCAYGFVIPKDLVDALQLKMQYLDGHESAPVAVDGVCLQKGTVENADDEDGASTNQREIVVTVKKGLVYFSRYVEVDVEVVVGCWN